ncbi:hypothetical protein Slin_0123 [Spirosoma linguale DSM 74]|uniref:Uncharacterized protein n=1 Tax=Spirosoma linguale (strain ATCC 33905 / DSM 74 / LMG 10896 / Claus 1) TaxID=504472 RepID=D2QC84_SPILD|nr:hypothetical protein Slin_0123 [Spirosoma linguale DSM 74]
MNRLESVKGVKKTDSTQLFTLVSTFATATALIQQMQYIKFLTLS